MSTTLPPLPSESQARAAFVLLTELHQLYGHYFFGQPLPANFPQSILNSYPNKSYKMQLKAAIVGAQANWNTLDGIQSQYLQDYYSLYCHYFFGQPLPPNFPESILNQFPAKSYKQELKNAIAQLTAEMNNEKAPVEA